MRALNTAATGMAAQQHQIDVIANNLANVNTPGFKKSRAEFQDLYYQQMRSAAVAEDGKSAPPIGLEVGQGVRVVGSQKMFTDGTLTPTGGKYDMAIEGRGFFKVLQGDKEVYTRAGNMQVNSDGRLVTANGYPLADEIDFPPGTVTVKITREGQVYANLGDGEEATPCGRIELTAFQNPAGLKSLGRGLFEAPKDVCGTEIRGVPGEAGLGTISHGYIEQSNVAVVEEMISMISAQRAYELNSKVVQATDQMLSDATRMR